MRNVRLVLAALCFAAVLHGAKGLEAYFIDVEGGQATLVVSPSGETMLIDTGWPGFNHRDADRITAAAKTAGVKRIDYLVITHYHADHVGGVPQLAAKIPIRNFVDHGPGVEKGRDEEALYKAYEEYRAKGNHIQVKPGDTIPIKGLQVNVLSAGGAVIPSALPGAGQANSECAAFKPHETDATENAQSVGMLITYGDFRMLDLGDLTWNKEFDLVCPNNKIGTVDAFVVSHHGMDLSDSPQLVHAIRSRVAIFDNGARKGGTPQVLQTVRETPGIADLWQLHYSVTAPKTLNTADPFIANVDEICQGQWLRLEAQKDGSFTIFNSRNKYEKSYAKK